MPSTVGVRAVSSAALAVLLSALPVRAQRPQTPPPRPVAVRPAAVAPPGVLGTFYPDSYLYYGGDVNPNSGYYPLGMYGANTLALDGPMSNLRATAAPVVTYTRGYDGTYWPTIGTSFSYPNLPLLGPVVYPTRASFSYGPRTLVGPPQWPRATYWIDQN